MEKKKRKTEKIDFEKQKQLVRDGIQKTITEDVLENKN